MKSLKSSGRPRKLLNSPVSFWRISGKSMLPTLEAGSIVMSLNATRRLKPGDIVVFWHNNKPKIKRLAMIDKEKIYLLGDNPTASTDSRSFDWLSKNDLIGKVIWPRAKPLKVR